MTDKHTSRGRVRIIVKVVMSSTTRVPDVNFSLSTLLRQPTTYRGPLLAFTITEETGVSVFSFISLINIKQKLKVVLDVDVPKKIQNSQLVTID